MKKTIPTIGFALISSLATSSMATANSHYQSATNHNQYSNHYNPSPSRQWHTGQYLPSHYHTARYQTSHRDQRQLPHAGPHQQWYKIKTDYVLVNHNNNRIVRVLRNSK